MNLDLGLVRTDRGIRFVLGRELAVPAATAWRVLTDVDCWEEWGPPVTDVEYRSERISAGTSGRVRAFGLFWVPFRIEKVTDSSWTWTVRGQTPPADGHRVEAIGKGRSRVVLELPLWAPWYLPLCWVALRNVARVAEAAYAGERGSDG